MSLFKRRKRDTAGDPAMPAGNPIPALLNVPGMLGELVAIFRDNRGKMSSKRFGAGALVAAGIALVNTGSLDDGNPAQFWGGLGLCALGVILFGLTRWEPTGDQ